MYSYNNIVAKPAPAKGVTLLDPLLDDQQRTKVVEGSTYPVVDVGTVTQLKDVDATIITNLLSEEECDRVLAACNEVGWTFWADAPDTEDAGDDANEEEEEEEEEAMIPGEAEALGKTKKKNKRGVCNKRKQGDEDENNEDQPEQHDKSFRSADTIEVDLPTFTQEVWKRLAPHLQQPECSYSEDMEDADNLYEVDMEGTWKASQLSDNLLFARYLDGGHFAPHVDGTSIVDLNTRSLYTVLIYLNDCGGGGRTHIMTGDQCAVLTKTETGKVVGNGENIVCSVVPKKGSAVIFYHNVLHEGEPVIPGNEKFIIRGDVLFRRTPPILNEPKDIEAFQLYQDARIVEANGDAMGAMSMFKRVRRLSPGVADLYQL